MKKVVSIAQVAHITQQLKAKSKKIVLAGGCFDILHIGHIIFLEKAKKLGDVLVLLLESDETIKKLKGKKRPINIQENRAKILSSIESVDLVVMLPSLLKNEDYQKIVWEIKPDVIAITKGDLNIFQKKSQAKQVGGIVKVVLKKIPEHSTTKILGYF